MWPRRLESTLRRSTGHAVLYGAPEFGAQVVVNGLRLHQMPTVRLGFPAVIDYSRVLYGNLLSDSLDEAFGFRLFGYGLPFEYGLAILKAQSQLLGHFAIAVTGADAAPPRVMSALLELESSRVRVIAAIEAAGASERRPDVKLIGPDQLALTLDEAKTIASDFLSDAQVESIWTDTRGAYLEFLTQANRATSLPPLQLVSRPAEVPEDAARHLLSLFVRQGRWIEALEVAIQHDTTQALELFRQSARLILEQGLHDRLWELVGSLDPTAFEADDELFYLYFRAATATNHHRALANRVRQYLDTNEAPDLRARWAVAMPTQGSLAQAERAFRSLRNINTARALAFVKALANQPVEAVAILRDALEIAQSMEDERQVAMLALDISHSLVFGGQYASAKRWAQWGLGRHLKSRVGDELLRLNLVNQIGYLRLLTDELGGAEELLSTAVIPDDLIGIPMMEALLSTRGDLSVVKDDLHEALGLYERYYESLPIANVGFGALDVIRVLVRMNDLDEARRVLAEARDLLGPTQSRNPNQTALEIASGHIAMAEGRLVEAAEAYAAVTDCSGSDPTPFLLTQAVLNLACVYAMSGDTARATSVLNRWNGTWKDLGLSGWLLFSASPPHARKLRDLVHGGTDVDTLRLLGDRVIVRNGLVTRLSLRHAELAALLAVRNEGYRSEELLLELYGDDGKEGSLKALLSRLRKLLPIHARPYRLEGTVSSDIENLEACLAAGDTRQALELYKGPLLPESEAPGVIRARERIDEAVRQAVIHAGEADLAVRLARKFPEDLELWEAAKELTPKDDPAYPLIRARVRRIRGEWGL